MKKFPELIFTIVHYKTCLYFSLHFPKSPELPLFVLKSLIGQTESIYTILKVGKNYLSPSAWFLGEPVIKVCYLLFSVFFIYIFTSVSISLCKNQAMNETWYEIIHNFYVEIITICTIRIKNKEIIFHIILVKQVVLSFKEVRGTTLTNH